MRLLNPFKTVLIFSSLILMLSLGYYYLPDSKAFGTVEAQTCVSPVPIVSSYLNLAIPKTATAQSVPVAGAHDLCILQGLNMPSIPGGTYEVIAFLQAGNSKSWSLIASSNAFNQTADVMCFDWP
jgi:hypothetical protein